MTQKKDDEIFKRAVKLQNEKKYSEALSLFKKLEIIYPQSSLLNFYLGTLFLQLDLYKDSKKYLIKSLNVGSIKNETLCSLYNNLALACKELHQYDEAKLYIEKSLKRDPNFYYALINECKINLILNNFEEVKKKLKKLELLYPNNSEVFNIWGNLYFKNEEYENAILNYKKAEKLNKNDFFSTFNLGSSYERLFSYNLAAIYYEKAKKLNPKYHHLSGKILHMKMYISSWNNFDELKSEIANTKLSANPFISLSSIEDAKIQKIIAEDYASEMFKNIKSDTIKIKRNHKIKIGYFSSDFRSHAFTHLFYDILKNHDSDLFEIYGFYYGPKVDDKLKNEIKKYFHKFLQLSDVSSYEIAQLSKKIGIDIAMNLNGYTKYERTDLFKFRAAPVQVNFLGYPGTMGAKFIDYIIADKIVIPEGFKKFYTEKVIYLERCYQPNRGLDVEYNSNLSKSDLNIPNDKFIFCNLNNNFKITPKIFDLWTQILLQSPNSCLCLLSSNEISDYNLTKYANSKGIESERLIFLPKLKFEDHMKRFEYMDLFLDTFPYGAHTTASEAMRKNLPLITLQGETFASRVASSILYHMNCSSLIAKSTEEYKHLAIELYANQERYKSIKNELIANTPISPLFKPLEFTRNLEEIYKNIYETHSKDNG